MPFDVSRAYDEAKGIDNPRIWTAERDIEMWQALESAAAVSSRLPTSRAPTAARPIRTRPEPVRHPVVIVGGGPVGLALAADLGVRGVPCVVVDGKAEFGEGSRGLCYAKRTLEILDRLGVGERAVAKGVTWQLGKVFHGTELLYQFNLLPEGGHKMPAFINLQQYYIEQYLYERCQELPDVDLRFQNKCVGVETFPDHARIDLETPDGPYAIEADWLIACDGSRSTVRQLMGLSFEGRVFEDRFLIADIKMPADYPAERWFWFDPPFNPGQSALLHKQPDDIWRIDLQLGWDADPVEERKPERVRPRLEAMLGKDRPFEFEWISIYTFQCRRLETLRPRAGDLRRRRRAPGLALRRARLQQRRAGHRQPRLEARGRAGGPGAAGAARHLRARARGRGRREPPQLHPLDRLHHPQVAGLAHDPRCRAVAGGGDAVRPHPGQLGPPVDALGLRHAALDARHRAVRRHGPAWARRCRTRPWRGADGGAAWLLDRLGRRFTLLYCGAELPCAAARRPCGWSASAAMSPTPRACSSSATTPGPARPGWCAPTSICAARFRRLDARTRWRPRRSARWAGSCGHDRPADPAPNLQDPDGFYAASWRPIRAFPTRRASCSTRGWS